MVSRVADGTLQLFGGAGYRKDEPIERIWREVRAIRILEGTPGIVRNIIARDMLRNRADSDTTVFTRYPQSRDQRHDHAKRSSGSP